MAWVESQSASFHCRHASSCTDEAVKLLAGLEDQRGRLGSVFPDPIGDLTIVLHDGPRSLAASNPTLPALWRATERTSRVYLTGWAGDRELHLLSPPALRARAGNNQVAARALSYAAATLYTRRVIVQGNPDLQRSLAPARTLVSMRWAWLLEGGSRWFSGESAAAKQAVIQRLRTGPAPDFPPAMRDAPLLAGTVIDLLVREEGEAAALTLLSRLHPGGSRAALASAFGGRPMVHTEGTWRSYLARLAGSR
ncbi:MAG: hypothetical protein J2O48_05700 [Solirubrobacterales bacterium]|nr:hypothetical protein [Solirubrobacterales bacterium]